MRSQWFGNGTPPQHASPHTSAQSGETQSALTFFLFRGLLWRRFRNARHFLVYLFEQFLRRDLVPTPLQHEAQFFQRDAFHAHQYGGIILVMVGDVVGLWIE